MHSYRDDIFCSQCLLIIFIVSTIVAKMMIANLLLLPLVCAAFVVQPLGRPHTLVRLDVAGSRSSSADQNVDMMRAHECAEKFGTCDLDEVEELRDSLHDARIRTMFLASVGGAPPLHLEDQLIEQRLLEEDLSLQLTLLNEAMPESALFHEEATMHPEQQQQQHLQAQEMAGRQSVFNFMDENLLESLTVCAIFGVLALAPHLVLGE